MKTWIMSDIIFTTERLTIRQLSINDFDDFYVMQSNPKVMRYIKPVLNYDEIRLEMIKFIGYYSNPNVFYNIWAVANPENNKLIGICGVYENQQTEYEIAYRLKESEWGHGYGKEIAHSLIDYSLSVLDLPRLVAYAYTKNINSTRILDTLMDFVEERIHEKTGLMGRKYSLSKSR